MMLFVGYSLCMGPTIKKWFTNTAWRSYKVKVIKYAVRNAYLPTHNLLWIRHFKRCKIVQPTEFYLQPLSLCIFSQSCPLKIHIEPIWVYFTTYYYSASVELWHDGSYILKIHKVKMKLISLRIKFWISNIGLTKSKYKN